MGTEPGAKTGKLSGTFRKPRVSEAGGIQKLINYYAKKDEMLPRAINDIYETIRDFHVYEEDSRILACCAIHVDWEDLAEIRSLAVEEGRHGRGIGKHLVKSCIDDARELGVTKIFALTYIPKYFEKFGFHEISKDELPRKIWSDCIKCPKFPDCDELAVMIDLA